MTMTGTAALLTPGEVALMFGGGPQDRDPVGDRRAHGIHPHPRWAP